ncbi:MAG: PAS domain S-box protein [Cyanobacteria bacterium P01_F01_bin.86]
MTSVELGRVEEPPKSHEQLLQGIVQANKLLLTVPQLQTAVPQALACLGKATGVDRVYVYKHCFHLAIDEWILERQHEWARNGFATDEWRQSLSYCRDGLTRWLEVLAAKQPIYGSRNTFSESEQTFLQRSQIQTVLIMPLFVEQQLWGILGFDACRDDRSWTDIERTTLQIVVDSLGGAIAHQQNLETLHRNELHLQKLLQAQQDAVPVGVIVIDKTQKITSINRKFSEMWNIPEALLASGDDQALLSHILDQVEDTEAFLAKIEYLHSHPEEKSQDEIHLKNGKIFYRFSAPIAASEGLSLSRIWYLQDITERKQAELQVQESYALLNSVLNGTQDLIFAKDTQGKYLLTNESLIQLIGNGREDLLGLDDTQLYPLETAQEIQDHDQQLFQDRRAQTYEQQIPINGEIRTFLTSKTPYWDTDNNIVGLVGVSRDVTELQQVREERDRFFRLSSDMMCIIGFDGYLKRVNPSFTRILGYVREELQADPLIAFIHPDDQATSAQMLARLVGGELFQTFENRWRCKNGDYRWFSWSVTPYSKSQIFYATARDITDRRQTEAALQESEKRFRDVTEAAGEYVWEISRDGIYTFLTEKAEGVKGHTVEALLGRSLVAIVHPEDKASLENVLQEASTYKHSFRAEHRTITATRQIVWEEISGLPILDDNGDVIGFRGTGLSITAKKQADASLRLFKQAVESSSDALCITNADFETVYYNHAFADLFEVQDIQEYDADWESSDALYADPRVAQIVFKTLQKGQRYASEVIMRSYRGQTIPTLLRANTIRDETDTIVGSIRAYTDISERKTAEAQLQLQEEFLRSIYDGTAHRIFALNVMSNGKVIYSGHNRAAEEATGRSSDSIAGLTPIESLGAERGPIIQDICQRCIKHKQSIIQEEHITLNGQESWVLTTFNPLQDHLGRVHRIIGTTFDITPIKQAEAKLKQQAKIAAFRAAIDSLLTRGEDIRSMLRGCCEIIVEHMEAAFARIWTLDTAGAVLELQASSGLYTHINGNYARIPVGKFKIGLIAAEKKAHLTNDVQHDPRIGNPDWAKREGMVAFAGYPLVVDNQLVGVVALFARHPLSEKAFATLGLVADEMALGIKRKQTEVQLQCSETQLRQQAMELQTTLQELQRAQSHLVQSEKMSSLGQLVAGVAHEINNPVNFIYGNLTYARNYAEDLLNLVKLYQTHYTNPHPDIAQEADAMELEFVMQDFPKLLNSMKVGSERIQSIVSSLRIFSRMDEAEMKAVDLHASIESTLMILQNRLKVGPDLTEIKVNREYADLPQVECYAGQLNQVFMNIISNAIDALTEIRTGQHPTKCEACITIQTQQTDDHQVSIHIRDNGTGIPETIRDRLFDPFFTTKPIGKGTGMGLSISYQIITEKHGGRLTYQSEMNEGTTFKIKIPLKQLEQ